LSYENLLLAQQKPQRLVLSPSWLLLVGVAVGRGYAAHGVLFFGFCFFIAAACTYMPQQ
jgi:hypothetical protein